MTSLEFQFSSEETHQTEAVEATCNLFGGQQFTCSSFTIDDADLGQAVFDDLAVGHGNEIRLAPGQLLANLHEVQEEGCLPLTNVLTDGRLRDFTIEMETGTGKTYVYIRSIYELNKRYGLTKFMIVVPSVAVREGVLKSFQIMRTHFEMLYDRTPLDYFVYDSNDMDLVGNFATSNAIQVMIINIDAFNKGIYKDGTAIEGNLFHRRSEKLIGGFSPRELVGACKPIVIIDEPQSVDNTRQAKSAIKSLNPLFVLRYSATHKQPYNMIYRLTPVDAFEQHLVKSICVDSVKVDTNLNGAYVRLDSVKSSPFSAKLTIDVRQKNGVQKRKAITVKTGTDLFAKSGENTDYEDGWIVSNIGTAPGDEFIAFQNGEQLDLGETLGDVNEELIKRAQIRRTIENHMARQLDLWKHGVKVLSLFFIDKVARYRVYEPEVHGGVYAQMFEEEYAALLHSRAPRLISKAAGLDRGTWRECYERVGAPLVMDPHAVHQGYFAQDKAGRFKDSREAAGTAADASAFELIMKKKETLISFPNEIDQDTKVSFIFSHSALKEGWDNPNVFQICTLVDTKDTLTKRQKIGRGLRLCVNQKGGRLRDPESNILTVVANESYEEFANGLQKELESDNFVFGVISPETFSNVVLTGDDGVQIRLGYDGSKRVYEHFFVNKLIDSAGAIKPELKIAAEQGSVSLPDEFTSACEQISAIILRKAQKLQVHDKAKEVVVDLEDDVVNNEAFQALWSRIRQRTQFFVDVDSNELIKKAAEEINQMPKIVTPQVTSERANMMINDAGVTSEATETSMVLVGGGVTYDLPDPISELQDAVNLTRGTIKAILERCTRFDQFKVDPATFLAQVGAAINRAKNEVMVEGIRYVPLPEEEWHPSSILEIDGSPAYLDQNAWKPKSVGKSLYSYVVYDSAGIEREFAKKLDMQEEVVVYAKLPPSFTIDTPLGSYNPDWAYVEESEGEERLYFVIETKGGTNVNPVMRPAEELKTACACKHFEALDLGSDFHYGIRATYEVGRAAPSD